MSKHPLAQTQIHLISLSLLICLVFNYSPQETCVGGPPSLSDTRMHSPKIFISVSLLNCSIFIKITHIQRKITRAFHYQAYGRGQWKTSSVKEKFVYFPEAFRTSTGPTEINYTMILSWSFMYAVYVCVYRSAGLDAAPSWSNCLLCERWKNMIPHCKPSHKAPLPTWGVLQYLCNACERQ